MPKIVPIGEGKGESKAAQLLYKKVLKFLDRTDIYVDDALIAKGIGNLTKAGGIEKFIDLAFTSRDCGAVIVLVDADDLCPMTLANHLAQRVRQFGVIFPVAIVVAKCEYEVWFLASLASIKGQMLGKRPGIPQDAKYIGTIEDLSDVKKWLSKQLPGNQIYKEATDQEAMTKLIDVETARANSRSFRRLCHAVEEMLAAIDSGEKVVTPLAKG